MDPIHPILPTQVTIPPVTPAPMTGRIDREKRRDQDAEKRPRDRRVPQNDGEPDAGDAVDVDDGGHHIDLTA